jgi:DNA processing protein
LALALVPELPPTWAFALSARLGGPEAVLATGVDRLVQAGVAPEVAASVARAAERVPAQLAALARIGGRVLAWSDADYPAVLRHIPDPPLALMVRGDLPGDDEIAIAVVGTRRATSYGRRVAEELARDLAAAGVTVVSGLATGIDAAAHRGALEAGGRTVAVLGTGVDDVYPSWHRELAAAIVGQGALVSEFACGTAPLAFHFPRRNRLISGLTRGTIVVEAAEKSGSLITARYALEQGREVFAVPGPLGPVAHRGPHRLIREGARLVTCADDVLAELAPALRHRLAARRKAAAEAVLTLPERRLLDALGTADAHVDDVIRAAALAPAAALETLLALELRGLVRQLPGKRFRRQAA